MELAPTSFASPTLMAARYLAAWLVVAVAGAFPPIAVAAPPNDDFASAAPLVGLPALAEASNEGATAEPGEPWHGSPGPSLQLPEWQARPIPPGGRSLWWTWTAPRSGSVAVQTCGSDIFTTLGVYTGGVLATLTEIASNRDSNMCEGRGSRVAFFATAGRAYSIAVDSQAQVDAPEQNVRAIGTVRLEVRQAGYVGLRLLPSVTSTGHCTTPGRVACCRLVPSAVERRP